MTLRKSILTIVAFLACLALSPQSLRADDEEVFKDQSLQIKETSAGSRFGVWIMPPRSLETTLTLEFHGSNMKMSSVSPITIDVCARTMDLSKPKLILEAHQADNEKPWDFHWNYSWKNGVRGGHQSADAVYSLPFQSGVSCRVSQGFFGKLTHFQGSQEEYAVDLVAPPGTIICAAREGKVISVRSDSDVGGPDKKFNGAANYVIIKHSDGTYGSYLHMLHNSAMVKPGQSVSPGQAIGRVGSTGHVTEPHLHFDVSIPIDGKVRESIPIVLKTAEGLISSPSEGATYTAQ